MAEHDGEDGADAEPWWMLRADERALAAAKRAVAHS